MNKVYQSLLMLTVPTTLGKLLHLFMHIPIYKVSFFWRWSEDSLANVYKVL